jgi:hypothetical protein
VWFARCNPAGLDRLDRFAVFHPGRHADSSVKNNTAARQQPCITRALQMCLDHLEALWEAQSSGVSGSSFDAWCLRFYYSADPR